MNYLITGGCGFIGVNLINHILNKNANDKIRVIDNLSVGKRENLSHVSDVVEITTNQIKDAPTNRLELVVGDVREKDLALIACRGIDTVIHLAANTGVIPSIKDPMDDCTTNVLGTLNYLEAVKEKQECRFVFASSGAPLGEQVPPVHEEMIPHPISPYGASKLAGEAYCQAYYGAFGLDTVILRFGNVYGLHSSHKGSVVAKFIKHILSSEALPIYGDGTQSRDFIFTHDLIQAIFLAINRPHIGGHVFQIATHQEHTVDEIAVELNRLAEKHLGRKSEIVYLNSRKGEIRRNYSNISKARRLLGFEPMYDLERGLEETFLWFLHDQKKLVTSNTTKILK